MIGMADRPADAANTASQQSRESARARYPFMSLPAALTVLRVGTALLFMAHAAVRLAHNTIPSFALFLDNAGFPASTAIVWAITAFELGAGTAMILDRGTRYVAGAFAAMLVIGIVLIHWHFGWFVGEHGTGGSEYSVALIFALLVIAAHDASRAGRQSPSAA
jgi:putative oxidoreductase